MLPGCGAFYSEGLREMFWAEMDQHDADCTFAVEWALLGAALFDRIEP